MSQAPRPDDDDAVGKAYDHELAKRLLASVRPYRGRVAAAIALLLVTSVLELLGPVLTKIAIDDHVARGDLAGLGRVALAYLAVVVGGFAFEYWQFWIMQWVGQRIVFDLRVRLLRHVQSQELAYFDRNPVGRLMTRLTSG